MTPWQKAKAWQDEHDATTNFWTLLGEYLSAGVVHSTPNIFMLAQEARWNAEEKRFEDGEPNCWFIRLAAAVGCSNPVWDYMRALPHQHKYCAWIRRGQLWPRVYEWEKIEKKVKEE